MLHYKCLYCPFWSIECILAKYKYCLLTSNYKDLTWHQWHSIRWQNPLWLMQLLLFHATNRICEANELDYHLSSVPASPWLPCRRWSGLCPLAPISTSSTSRCSPNHTTGPIMRPRAAAGQSKPLLEVTRWSRWVFTLSRLTRPCEGIS